MKKWAFGLLILFACGERDERKPIFYEGYAFTENHLQDYSTAGELIRDFFRDKKFKESYCGCKISDGKRFDPSECGYKSKFSSTNQNTRELQHEHVVPASRFGVYFPEWQPNYRPDCTSGRTCTSKYNAVYKKMEADLWNLLPVIGELNNVRSDLPPGECSSLDRPCVVILPESISTWIINIRAWG